VIFWPKMVSVTGFAGGTGGWPGKEAAVTGANAIVPQTSATNFLMPTPLAGTQSLSVFGKSAACKLTQVNVSR
jgi:hypothetical protein